MFLVRDIRGKKNAVLAIKTPNYVTCDINYSMIRLTLSRATSSASKDYIKLLKGKEICSEDF